MSTDHDQPTASPPVPTDPAGGQNHYPFRLQRLILVVLAVVAVYVVYGFATGQIGGRSGSPGGGPVTVTYEITTSAVGGATADITYTTAAGISQQNGIHVPQAVGGGGITVSVPAGTFVSVSAQLSAANGDQGAQDISCGITSGGSSIARNTATGAYAITTCEGHA